MGHLADTPVTAVIVTRGDVPLYEILLSLPSSWPVVIWDNSQREDLSVYGRYAALAEIETQLAYVQDDDCVLEQGGHEELLRVALEHPGVLVANMPDRFRHSFYREHCLVGFGAIFDRDLPARAFDRYFNHNGNSRDDPLFLKICDVVFTTLVTRHLVDVEKRDLPWASAPERMWKQKDHQSSRSHMLRMAKAARDA